MSTKDEDEPRPKDRGGAGGELSRGADAGDGRLAEAARLAARVRHEINNALTGLVGQTQLLLREELSEKARRRVHAVEQLAARVRDAAAELRALESADGAVREGSGAEAKGD
jgi:signal transduction histidine kinase